MLRERRPFAEDVDVRGGLEAGVVVEGRGGVGLHCAFRAGEVGAEEGRGGGGGGMEGEDGEFGDCHCGN